MMDKSNDIVVSIIVPVYNAEKTLRRCVESVLNQTFKEYELILIDDGSTDGSGLICDEYSGERVKVFHIENSGVSKCRNLAMDKAQGKYLQFLDSDDWLAEDATENFVKAITGYDCDMVITDFYRVVKDRCAQKGDITEEGCISINKYAEYLMEKPANFYYGVVWNKFFKKSMVEEYHLRMDEEINWCEDFIFNLQYLSHAKSVFILHTPLYYYEKTKKSLSNQNFGPAKVMNMKTTVFKYYDNFFRAVLNEEEYEKNRLQIYSFYIKAASDGSVLTLRPAEGRILREERQLNSALLEGDDILSDMYRMHKFLWLQIEEIAERLQLEEEAVWFIYCLKNSGCEHSWKSITELTGISRRKLSRIIKNLEQADIIDAESKAPNFMFGEAAGKIFEELENIGRIYDQTRFKDVDAAETEYFNSVENKIRKNVSDLLIEKY